MKCCNEECVTKFCPHCGKQLSDHPLTGLLHYVRWQERQAKARVENAIMRVGKDSSDYWEKTALVRQKKADEWSRWAAALVEIMEKNQ